VIDYAVEGIREELQKRFEELNAGLGQMRQMKRQIEGELARLVQAIAENPRYFLARKRLWRAFREDYFAVPDILARKKEIAEFFAKRWGRRVGPVQLVYARTPEGRRMLLRARVHSLAGAFQKRSERVSCWKWPTATRR
jgi:hypothetical protein